MRLQLNGLLLQCIVVATAQPTTTWFSQSPEFDLCNTAASDGSWGVVKVLGLVGSHANSSGGSNVYAIGGFQSNGSDGCSPDYADPVPGCSVRLYIAVWASDDSGATWRCKRTPAEVARISSALVVYDLLSESVRNGGIVDPGRCRLVCVAGGLQDTDDWAASRGVVSSPDDGNTWVSQEELPFAVIDAMLIQVGRGSLMLLGGHRPGAVNDSAASVLIGNVDANCRITSWTDIGPAPFGRRKHVLAARTFEQDTILVGAGVDLSEEGTPVQQAYSMWSTGSFSQDSTRWQLVELTCQP